MNRFVVLDVPMNCGKTHTIERLCKHESNSTKTIVNITHRKALAITLGDKYGGCTSYTDKLFEHANFDYKRVSITSNSLCKIPPEFNFKYDILIIDEAGWFRLNMISKTMKTCWGNVLLKLETLIKATPTVIIMQDILTENDVSFYTQLKGLSSIYDTSILSIRMRYKKQVKEQLHYSKKCNEIYHILLNYLRRYGSQKTVLVACTSKNFAESTYKDLYNRALGNQLGGIEQDKIRLVTADSKQNDWRQNFFKNPTLAVQGLNIIIVNSVISTGHSIDNGINKIFYFCHNNILCHEEELQLLARARKSPCLDAVKICFIEPGKGGRYETRYEKQYDAIKEEPMTDLMHCAFADVACAYSDTINRHFWLFKRDETRFAMSKVGWNIPAYPYEEIDDTKIKIDDLLFRNQKIKSKASILSYLNDDCMYEQLGDLEKQKVDVIHRSLSLGTNVERANKCWSNYMGTEKIPLNPDKLLPFVSYLTQISFPLNAVTSIVSVSNDIGLVKCAIEVLKHCFPDNIFHLPNTSFCAEELLPKSETKTVIKKDIHFNNAIKRSRNSFMNSKDTTSLLIKILRKLEIPIINTNKRKRLASGNSGSIYMIDHDRLCAMFEICSFCFSSFNFDCPEIQ